MSHQFYECSLELQNSLFFFFSIVNLIMSLASLDKVSRFLSGIPGQWSFAKAETWFGSIKPFCCIRTLTLRVKAETGGWQEAETLNSILYKSWLRFCWWTYCVGSQIKVLSTTSCGFASRRGLLLWLQLVNNSAKQTGQFWCLLLVPFPSNLGEEKSGQ